MRIAFVSRRYFPAISGMSVYAQNLVRRLVAAGHDVTMISQYRGYDFGRAVYGGGPPPPVSGVRVVGREQLGEQDGGDFERDIDELVATIRAEHARAPFDVLHAQYGYPTGYAVAIASRLLGVPCVTSIQGGDGHWVGSCCTTHETAMRRVIEDGGPVLIGGVSFRTEVAERLRVAPARFTIVPGAVDTDNYNPKPDRALGALAEPPVLLYHGRVDRRKGVLDFIEALRSLAPRLGYRAVVSGIGPDVDVARAAIAAAGLEDRVEMRGYVGYDEVAAVYRASDIFVSPTYAEGFSNTILEAMASALPIVSCRSVGVVDALRDGENASLVEAGDVPALAAAIERLVRDSALRERLAATALAECRRTYSWLAVAARIVETYTHAIDVGVVSRAPFAPIPIEPCRFRATPHLL